ncbi:MAG: hypothetical protein MZV64_19495 [Ignavibacteriales bacterium]|nr:hypothetical protein [Ignavibacteriales bacterium]
MPKTALPVPQALEDLTKPEYTRPAGRRKPCHLIARDLPSCLATVAHFGEDGYLDYWRASKPTALSSWTAGRPPTTPTSVPPRAGDCSRWSSRMEPQPAAEVIFADPPIDDAPTASILGPDTCFRQIEFVGILKGTQEPRPRRKIRGLHARASNSRKTCRCKCSSTPSTQTPQLPEAFIKYAQAARTDRRPCPRP